MLLPQTEETDNTGMRNAESVARDDLSSTILLRFVKVFKLYTSIVYGEVLTMAIFWLSTFCQFIISSRPSLSVNSKIATATRRDTGLASRKDRRQLR